MKIYKLFPLALAAMAFASCSNEDENGQNPNGEKGELVEAITVSFENSASTYAATSEDGKGNENLIYKAFIFAKEAAPSHGLPQPGDYTVKMVTGEGDAAIGNVAGDKPYMDRIATFTGVSSGDSVFVIANDPTMTEAIANGLAHAGSKSHTNIKEYQAKLEKEYLNGLVAESGKTTTTGKFFMTGCAAIPKADNGTTITVPVKLDRELAKVEMSAVVTTNEKDFAFGKVDIKDQAGTAATWNGTDGLIVVRIPRVASPFTKMASESYFPLKATAANYDWFFDPEGKIIWDAFAGDKNSDPATATAPFFNNTLKNVDAKEFRYTWTIGETPDAGLLQYNAKGAMISPAFYVTPSYSGKENYVSALIQATYTGETTVDKAIDAAVLAKLVITDAAAKKWDDLDNLTALLTKITEYTDNVDATDKVIQELKAKYAGKTATDLVDYKTNCKLFYPVSISEYVNDVPTYITKRNHYYKVEATITTLGAKTIEDAIAASNINIIVKVTVNPWSVIVNKINV